LACRDWQYAPNDFRGLSVRRSGRNEQGRRGARRARQVVFLIGIPPLSLIAGCHGSDTPPPMPAPQAMPAASAPAAAATPQGQGTLGDLARETDWRRRTADKLRRMP
jgi:hypothetical protein